MLRLPTIHPQSNAQALKDINFHADDLAAQPLPYEKLDQFVFELLLGVR